MKLEEGDVQAAKTLYKRSAEIKPNASSLFNLGVTHYHLSATLFTFALKGLSPFAHRWAPQRNSMKLLLRGKSQ